MKNISGKNIDELYYNICKEVYENPQFETKPRDQKTKECICVSLMLHNPRERIVGLIGRDLSLKYLAGELAFYFAGSNKVKFISYYSKFWEGISDDGKTVNSAYGKKLMFDKNRHNITQFSYAYRQLEKDQDTRKAVMIIYDKHSADLNTKDNPCTLSLQFLIRNNTLYLITTIRSNDIWLGIPYDFAYFTILQELMWMYLRNGVKACKDLKLGVYVHNVGSLHMYERNFEKIKSLIERGPYSIDTSDKYTLPPITLNTAKQCPLFVEWEEWYRERKDHGKPEVSGPIDPFFIKLMSWIKGE